MFNDSLIREIPEIRRLLFERTSSLEYHRLFTIFYVRVKDTQENRNIQQR